MFTKLYLPNKFGESFNNQIPLLHNFLKAVRHSDIMGADILSNPSYVWRLLLWSITLLELELMWKVGTGEDIGSWRDVWIPGLHSGGYNLGLGPQLWSATISPQVDGGMSHCCGKFLCPLRLTLFSKYLYRMIRVRILYFGALRAMVRIL